MDKFVLHSKVADRESFKYKNADPIMGEVIAVISDDELIVEWSSDTTVYSHVKKESPSNLMSEAEVDLEQAKREVERSRLEKEFEKCRSQILEKLQQASFLVKEVNDICQSYNIDSNSIRYEYSLLFKELKDVGWSASTIKC